MDGAPEGLELARRAREALKRRPQGGDGDEAPTTSTASPLQPAAKRAKLQERPPPTCSHEVEVPKDYDPAAHPLDPAVHGASAYARLFGRRRRHRSCRVLMPRRARAPPTAHRSLYTTRHPHNHHHQPTPSQS